MQKITRFHLMHFSFDEQTQDKNLYDDAKAELNELFSVFNKYKTKITSDMYTCVSFPYNYQERQYLSICLYKNQLFMGLYNEKEKTLTFTDDHQHLIDFYQRQKYNFGLFEYTLGTAIKNEIDRNVNKTTLKQHIEAWNQQLPVLDQIIAYQTEVKQLTGKLQDIEKHTLKYDRTIDNIISGKNKTLADLKEKALAATIAFDKEKTVELYKEDFSLS